MKSLASNNETNHVSCGVFCRKGKTQSTEYYKAYVVYNRMLRWGMYKGNPDCVKRMINYQYWDAVEKSEAGEKSGLLAVALYGGIILIGLVIIVVLVIVTIVKRRRWKKETNTLIEE